MNVLTRVLSLLFLASSMMLVVACVESRYPLSDKETSKVDERLVGVWQDDTKTMVCRVKVSPGIKGALETETSDENGTGRALLFLTTIEGKHYMSLGDLNNGETPEPQTWQIYQYRFADENTLEVRGMEHKVLKKAFEDRELTGTVGADRMPLITDSPEKMARYLKAHSDECYPLKTDLMLTFRRQK